jgi:uncharacterized protein YbcI
MGARGSAAVSPLCVRDFVPNPRRDRGREVRVNATGAPTESAELTEAISAAMVELYAAFYEHSRTTATTYINDSIVVCVLENILTEAEDALIVRGGRGEVIDGRVSFQTATEDEFTAAIERLTHRRVVAFLSANQTTPGVACELFFLDAPPLAVQHTR